MGTIETPPSFETVVGGSERKTLAVIVRQQHAPPGISFVTKDESVHQVGILCWPKGHVIDAHVHNPLVRKIDSTQEVLFIRGGRVRLDLYDDEQIYVCSRELVTGDVVLLASGGHGLEMLVQSEIVEVKQGPYFGEQEKTCFAPIGNPHFGPAHHG